MSSPTAPAPPAPAPRSRFDATVEFNRFICREHYRLRLRITRPFPATKPGQFVQLGCRPPNGAIDADALLGRDLAWEPGQRPDLHQPELCNRLAMLRRPFSLAGRGDDEHGTWIDIIHRIVGTGTDWLAQLNVGDPVDLIGPLGNAFTLPDDKHVGLLVGGGVGLPPMFYLAQAMKTAGWDAVAFVGAMTHDLLAVEFVDEQPANVEGLPLPCVVDFARFDYPTVITTDDGSMGLSGRITDGLSRVLEGLPNATANAAVVYTCGPEPMMAAVAKLAEARGVDCQVCVEQAMACGMGTCQSCIVRIESPDEPHGQTAVGRPWRYRLACTDGPVFPSTKVVW
ncbi:hypothetical protein ACERK3_00745 [Phycisphaerales bacterium AB-hyl4]|uniref:FAD-binding FR-type domain-containing protein n=1 Tax=Natronomicrosphaera hydrolytica TaxID=3242702 RepID=A0ABV4U1R3_9BACT